MSWAFSLPSAATGAQSAGAAGGLGAGFASAFGSSLATGLAGLALAPALGGLQFGFNSAARARSWDKWKDAQTRGPLYTKIGYEQANMNPLLAIRGGFQTKGAAPQQQGNSQTQAAALAQPTALAAIENLRSSAALNVSNAGLAEAKKREVDANIQYLADQGFSARERGKLTGVERRLREFDIPAKSYLASWFKTPTGQGVLRDIERARANPRTWPGFAFALGQYLKGGVVDESYLPDSIKEAIDRAPEHLKTELGKWLRNSAKKGAETPHYKQFQQFLERMEKQGWTNARP